MSVNGALKKLICCALSGSLLFSQLAVAGYACPYAVGTKAMTRADSGSTLSRAGAPRDVVMPGGAMGPGCDQIDPDAANLCVEQCVAGGQSVDSARAPDVPMPTLVVLYVLPLRAEATSNLAATLPPYDAVLAASPPPHAILHCVFLI